LIKKRAKRVLLLTDKEVEQIGNKNVLIFKKGDYIFIFTEEEALERKKKIVGKLRGKKKRMIERYICSKMPSVSIKKNKIRVSLSFLRGP